METCSSTSGFHYLYKLVILTEMNEKLIDDEEIKNTCKLQALKSEMIAMRFLWLFHVCNFIPLFYYEVKLKFERAVRFVYISGDSS